MREPRAPEDEQRNRELLDMHPALLQPEAIEMRSHLLDARAEVERLRAELEDARAELGRRVAPVEMLALKRQRDEAQAEVKQWRATFGETALRDSLARLARTEAERDAAREQVKRVRGLVASASWEHALVKARDVRRALDGTETT